MTGTYSDKQRLTDTKDVLGDEVGKLYHFLHSEIIQLQFKWQEYKILYADPDKSKKRFDIQNKSAPLFFNMIQRMHWNDIIITITRITDNAQMGGFENATLERLIKLVMNDALINNSDNDENLNIEFKNAILGSLENIKSKCSSIREFRNKILVHNDWDAISITDKATPPPKVEFLQLDEVVRELWELHNLYEGHYFKKHGVQHVSIPAGDGAFGLLHKLNDGLEMRNLRKKARNREAIKVSPRANGEI
jgi:HEPN superfamily AbiU2-like protein